MKRRKGRGREERLETCDDKQASLCELADGKMMKADGWFKTRVK